jgi:GNAT superfamily N-acetyltransferase
MSIDIEIVTGDGAWPQARLLLETVWSPDVRAQLPWAQLTFAHADFRVLVEDAEGLACHVGIYWRDARWDGRKVRIGGIGAVATRPDCRRRGYASIALNAAMHTFREERATDFALLFCEPALAPFYEARRFRAFKGDIDAMQPEGPIRFDVLKPYVSDIRRAPREGVIDLCGLPW